MTTYGNLQNDKSQRAALEALLAGTAPLPAGWAGEGTVPRLVAEKLAETISVADRGAVGDGVTDDTAVIQAQIDALAANDCLELVRGKIYLVSGLTLRNYTKLRGNGAILKAAPGTTAVLTLPAQAALQTADRLSIDDLTIDGNDVASIYGIYTNNHASAVIRNVGIRQCYVGAYIQHAQFCTAYNLRCWDNTVGLYLRGADVGGGANSWSFYDYHGIGNSVGLVVNKGSANTSHSNYFRNPSLLDNSVCGAAFFNCYDCTIDGMANEFNADGDATLSFDSLTIKRSSVYAYGAGVQLVNPRLSEADADPALLAENGGNITITGTLSGYGVSNGHLADCGDATSFVAAQHVNAITGTACLPGGVSGSVVGTGFALVLPATTYQTDAVGNDITNPSMSSADSTGATSAADAIDSEMGPCREIVYAASAGTQSTNRARWSIPAGNSGRRAIAFNIKSSIDTRLGIGWSGNITNRWIRLKAGLWYRVMLISDSVSSGSQQFIVWSPDSDAPTVRFCRWQQVSGTADHRLIGSISAMARGAIRTYGSKATATSTDTTPSVALLATLVTANASATTISALDDGYEGQEVVVHIADANTTIDFTGTTLKGNAGADWSPGNGDFMRCRKIGSNWYCTVTDATA